MTNARPLTSLLVPGIFIAALILVGCGDSDDGEALTASPTSETDVEREDGGATDDNAADNGATSGNDTGEDSFTDVDNTDDGNGDGNAEDTAEDPDGDDDVDIDIDIDVDENGDTEAELDPNEPEGPPVPSGSTQPTVPVDLAAVPIAPSSGCEVPPEIPNPVQMQPLTVDETARAYLISVPTSGSTEPLPMIVDFHGYSEGAKLHTTMTNLQSLGATEGFITVTPQGSGPVPLWDFTVGSQDMDLVAVLLDRVEASHCVDTNRIFAAGLSNGAFMASAISCSHADRFAAVATVAGMLDIDGCNPVRPVPVIAFHGTADTYVLFQGGFGESVASLPSADGVGLIGDASTTTTTTDSTSTSRAESLKDLGLEDLERSSDETEDDATEGAGTAEETSAAVSANTPDEIDEILVSTGDEASVPEVADNWALRNGCDDRSTNTEVTTAENGEPINELAWSNCDNGASVKLFVIEGGGHAWPGSAFSRSVESLVGFTTLELDASQEIWTFFQDHPLVGVPEE